MQAQTQTAAARQRTESLEQWLAHHPLLVPLHGMHTRVKEHYQLAAEAMTQLIQAADHPNPKVRWFCAHELDHLATDQSIAALLKLTRDPVVKVRVEAVHALGCERCKQCKLNVDMAALMIDFALHDPEEKVRGAALHTLGYLPADARIAAALQQIIDDEASSVQLRREAQRKLKYHRGATEVNHKQQDDKVAR
ncbi:MAG: HEAT repeat domain-containing protein [Caldilineaceae bacterium]